MNFTIVVFVPSPPLTMLFINSAVILFSQDRFKRGPAVLALNISTRQESSLRTSPLLFCTLCLIRNIFHMIMSRPTPPETITSINATMTVLPAFELAGWTTATFLRGRGEAVKPGSLPFPVRFNRDALVADHHGMVRPCAGFHHNA